MILLESPLDIDNVRNCLSKYRIVKQIDAAETPEFSGPAVIVEYRPEANGYVSVDTMSSRWPDHMGDPKSEGMLFATWSMGHFGPLAFPYGLKRAGEQCRRWERAQEAIARHSAYLRVRSSYIFGGRKDAPVLPKDYDPRHELLFLTRMTSKLLNSPGTLCYFNPNGEVLASKSIFEESLEHHERHTLPPLDLWSNIRMFQIPDGWLLMDSVGNYQLDIPDHEVAFRSGQFPPGQVDNFIRNVSLYVLEHGDVIKDGDTIDGPGNVRWQARRFENGVSAPPRDVYFWLPFGEKGAPKSLLERKQTG
ncbi:MAG TPA: DUF4261 domain-containing protein [Chthoniobacteraceae bacterium]